jgi:flagella basal body P-ring formation protein FlgA
MLALCLPGQGLASDAGTATGFPALKLALYPGDTITADMIMMRPAVSISGLGAIVTEKDSVIGKVARRTLLPGQPIPKNALRDPYIVLQGKTVPLIFQAGNITITGAAQALESGGAGDVIGARNPDTGVTIRGVVQSDGSLRAQ